MANKTNKTNKNQYQFQFILNLQLGQSQPVIMFCPSGLKQKSATFQNAVRRFPNC